MAKINVLITGIGATPGICAAESLKLKFNSKELFIVGTDANLYAAGLYLRKYVDCGILVERAKNNVNKYIDTIKKIVKKYCIDFIMPATDDEILILKKYENSIKKDSVIASDLDTLEICTDQWLTYKTLASHDIIVKSWLNPNDVSLPCIIKPRQSQGSKNIYTAQNRKEFDILCTKTKNPIFQKLLVADEYTIDCIYNYEGDLVGAMPRKRILTAGGTSVITQNVRDEKLINLVKSLSGVLSFRGQINIQCIDNKIIEINPRVGGASILATYSDINMPAISLFAWLGKEIKDWYPYKDKVMTRYFNAVYLQNNQIISDEMI